MSNKSPNIENLIPLTTRTPEEQREIRSMGGKACQAKRRQRKTFKETLQYILNETNPQTGNSYLDDINLAQLKKALEGNTKAMEFLRDTYGERPAVSNIDLNSGDISIKIVQNDQNLLTNSEANTPLLDEPIDENKGN